MDKTIKMETAIKDIDTFLEEVFQDCSLEEKEIYINFAKEIAQEYYLCETEEELDKMQNKLYDKYKDAFPRAVEVVIKLYYRNLIRLWWNQYGVTFF